MDVRTYFLAFARMAPVQCVTWGHPDTTGIPNVDYFVSGEQIEPKDGANHYSEELYRLPAPPTYYPFPEIPDGLKVRADFAISQTRTFYLCPQSAVKFHPDIDQLFAGVLRNDDDADIYVIEGAVGHWTEQLRERWRNDPDVEHASMCCRAKHRKTSLRFNLLQMLFWIRHISAEGTPLMKPSPWPNPLSLLIVLS